MGEVGLETEEVVDSLAGDNCIAWQVTIGQRVSAGMGGIQGKG